MKNEKLIRRFFFGEMFEEERFDLEQRFIADADLFEEIRVVEDELIERYVRGCMEPAERSKFEKHFLTTAQRRKRVENSRHLLKSIDARNLVSAGAKKTSVGVAGVFVWDRLAAILRTPTFAAAGAFALIFAIIGGWAIYQNFDRTQPDTVRNTGIEKVEPTPVKSTPEPTASPVADDTPTTETNKIIETVTPSPTPTKTPSNVPPPNPVLALFAGTVRSGGKTNVLDLPKGATAAILQLNLESADYTTFTAELTNADGEVLFQRSGLRPRRSRINFTVPSGTLKRGDYVIMLFGKNDDGENESAADFQFRVLR